jgi:hypothetical protein
MQRPLPENTTLTTDIHVLGGIRNLNLSKRAVAALEHVANGIGSICLFNRKHSRRTEVQVNSHNIVKFEGDSF